MEAIWRWRLVTAVAPIAWGSTYFVTHELLPASHPLWGAAIRALPAGIVLALLARRLPHGSWWWKSLVLGTLNAGLFFALVYLAAQLLPTGVAAVVMAASPLVMMVLAALLVGQALRLLSVIGGLLGLVGVVAMLVSGPVAVNPWGVAASVGAMLMSSLGYVLASRWSGEVDVLASTSWQLLAGGLVVVPLAVVIEGAPPALTPQTLLGFAYLTLVATAIAFVAWFSGLRHLGPTDVGLIGLLNPVTGVLLGTLLAAERLSPLQVAGMVVLLVGVVVGQRTRRTPPAAVTPAPRPAPSPTGASRSSAAG